MARMTRRVMTKPVRCVLPHNAYPLLARGISLTNNSFHRNQLKKRKRKLLSESNPQRNKTENSSNNRSSKRNNRNSLNNLQKQKQTTAKKTHTFLTWLRRRKIRRKTRRRVMLSVNVSVSRKKMRRNRRNLKVPHNVHHHYCIGDLLKPFSYRTRQQSKQI